MLMRGSAEDKNLNTHYPNTVFLFPYPMLIFELGGVFLVFIDACLLFCLIEELQKSQHIQSM